jgi:5S rRNA maturation endonuclease (ribonuclease M5)
MDLERRRLLDELFKAIDCPVVVEGRKDREALLALGVEDVVQLNRGRSLLETVEALQGNPSVVLLTDLDREGKNLRRKLINLMSPYGIRENKRPREILAEMRVSHVEALGNIAQTDD